MPFGLSLSRITLTTVDLLPTPAADDPQLYCYKELAPLWMDVRIGKPHMSRKRNLWQNK